MPSVYGQRNPFTSVWGVGTITLFHRKPKLVTPITLVSSGMTFVVCTLLGFGAGILLSRQTGAGLWIPAMVLLGIAVGGAAALYQLLRTR